MNPAFSVKFDQMQENQPGDTAVDNTAATGNGDQYAEAGHIRNLCFVWPDSKQKAFNYSYLVSSEFIPQNNTIVLEFTTHTVTVIGLNLQKLFDQVLMQIALRITCTDARYNTLETEDKPIVNDIQVVAKD